MAERFHVVKYHQHGAAFVGVVAGLGRNARTWDAEHSRRAAQRHARALRLAEPDPAIRYRVESAT